MKLTDQQIAQIKDLYEDTGNKTEVSRITGHSRNTIIRHTKEKLENKASESRFSQNSPLFCNDHFISPNPFRDPVKVPHNTVYVSAGQTEARKLPRLIGSRDTFQLPKYKKVAFVSCTHHPYQNKYAIDAALNYISANRFDLIVLGGDQCDFYKISRFSKDPRRELKLQQEIDETIKFVRNVDTVGGDVLWIDGNHDDRMRRHIADTGLSGIKALEIPNLFELPERWAYAENQAHVRLGSLLMCHGDLAGTGSGTRHIAHNMYEKLATSVLFGHYHRFNRYYHTDYDRVQRAAFACGHMCDEPSADYVRSPGWQTGFCEVEYDHDSNLFSVRDHVITKGKFYANGRIWG